MRKTDSVQQMTNATEKASISHKDLEEIKAIFLETKQALKLFDKTDQRLIEAIWKDLVKSLNKKRN